MGLKRKASGRSVEKRKANSASVSGTARSAFASLIFQMARGMPDLPVSELLRGSRQILLEMIRFHEMLAGDPILESRFIQLINSHRQSKTIEPPARSPALQPVSQSVKAPSAAKAKRSPREPFIRVVNSGLPGLGKRR